MGGATRALGAVRHLANVAYVPRVRRAAVLRLRRAPNCFQPHNDTAPDRYPETFALIRDLLADRDQLRILSFGCSTGDEVFTLRTYLPTAEITGLDISAGNIRDCRRRLRRSGDALVSFRRARDASGEPTGQYDAILAMAVFRHGDLAIGHPGSCAGSVTFAAFERTIAGLARTLRSGGYLVIDHSNFAFADTATGGAFEVVAVRPVTDADRAGTPQYGPDDRVVAEGAQREIVFRKR